VAFTKEQALDAAKAILDGPRAQESGRLNRIHAALRPKRPWDAFVTTAQFPSDAPESMKQLARRAESNYLPLLVKTYRQVMKVDGYLSASDEEAREPWFWWQVNKLDSRQTGLVDSALRYGVGYATALPGTYGRGDVGPSVSLYSPREMTALYQDPEADEWPLLALAVDGSRVSLFDDELVYEFGMEDRPRFEVSPPSAALSLAGGRRLTYIDAKAHNTGVCPVVRYRDRNLLCGEESLGIVEPLLLINERITETTFQALVTGYFQAFKQRYLIGWVPKNEQEELKSGAGLMWYLDKDPKDINIGELSEGKADLELRNASIRDFAAIGQIPAQALGIDGISNISDATLAGLEAAKNREAGEITTSLGESHEQLLRLCAYIDGNESAADDYNSEVRWRDFEARSYAATIDGLVKLVQGLGLDPAIALEDVPGMTEQRLVRAQDSVRRSQGASVLEMLQRAGAQNNGDDNPAA
jgi:hypothetical protein